MWDGNEFWPTIYLRILTFSNILDIVLKSGETELLTTESVPLQEEVIIRICQWDEAVRRLDIKKEAWGKGRPFEGRWTALVVQRSSLKAERR